MRRYQWKRRKRLEAQQSTVTEPSVSGTVKTSARSAGIGKQAAVAGGIAAGILAAAYMGGALFFQSHFLPNTTVNGTDFSGRSAGALRSYMKEKIDGYELSILGKEGSSDTIRGSDIALSYEGNEEAERLLKKQNAFLWPGAFFTENAARIENGVSYDAELLDEKLQTLKAVTAEQTEPVSAAPKFDGSQFVPAREQEGTAVDMEVLAEAVRESISELALELDLEEEGCYKAPKYTSDSLEVQAACDTMNEYFSSPI